MTERRLTAIDRLLLQADRALRTLSPGSAQAQRPNPAAALGETEMSGDERRHVAGLMRVDHCGEVCAQALYQGQALTAKLPAVRQAMARAADEEIDHLAWCEQRLQELNSHPSVLNPAFYAASFTIGAVAGFIGDKVSLGFVAATEQQVCAHLDDHLKQLPKGDGKSRAILRQMRNDEAEHATGALAAGGLRFPLPVRRLMSGAAQVMTRTTYYF